MSKSSKWEAVSVPSSVGLLLIISGFSDSDSLMDSTVPPTGEYRSDAALTLSTAPKTSISGGKK